jgi:DDE_Tnp_1-associated
LLPPFSQEQSDVLLAEAALQRITDLLEAVPDPPSAHGLRYDLPFLLTCLVAALLCNCDGTEAVAQWCRDHPILLRQVFGPRLFLTGSRLTLSVALTAVGCCGHRTRTGNLGASNESQDLVAQIVQRRKISALEQLAHQNTQPNFDLIHPGGVLRRVIKHHSMSRVMQKRGAAFHRLQNACGGYLGHLFGKIGT